MGNLVARLSVDHARLRVMEQPFRERDLATAGLACGLKVREAVHDNLRLALALGADPTCWNIGRILRPPGTLNHKTTPPREVALELWDRSRAVTVEGVLADAPEIAAREVEARWRGRPLATWEAIGCCIRAGDYVRVSGNLVSDNPHNEEGGQGGWEWLDRATGNGDVNEWFKVSRAWGGGRSAFDSANPARWTEIHSPDIIEPVPGMPSFGGR
jgi:hypothetical protein